MRNKLSKGFIELPNNKKLLVIVGPTASGKTALALKFARKFDGELVSADSRQIYRGLDIGTGKDLPQGARFSAQGGSASGGKIQDLRLKNKIEKKINLKINLGYYELGSSRIRSNSKLVIFRENPPVGGESRRLIRIWGLDLIEPNQVFSVSQWVELAKLIIDDMQKRNKLAIVVGGTGFWVKALLDGIPWGRVPPNEDLRFKIQDSRVEELQEILKKFPKQFWQNLTESDWKNKRRLIRRIEVAEFIQRNPKANVAIKGIGGDLKTKIIQLCPKIYDLRFKIYERIEKRLKQGLLEEIKSLLNMGYTFSDLGMNALGYKEFREYFEYIECHPEFILRQAQDGEFIESISGSSKMLKPFDFAQGKQVQHDEMAQLLNKAIERWKYDEWDYARRQLMWNKKYFRG